MKKAGVIIIAIIAVIVIAVIAIGGFLVGRYNKMVDLDQEVVQAQAQVEVQLQRRFDLIPNLVESVKGIMKQEQEVFTAIANARTKYAGAESGTNEKIEAAGEYEGAISRLLVIMENYPEIKSNQQVTQLMDELSGTENRISVERRRFNEVVTDYNKYIKKFPEVLLASMFGFEEKDLFEAVEEANVAPDVEF